MDPDQEPEPYDYGDKDFDWPEDRFDGPSHFDGLDSYDDANHGDY